MSSVNLEEADTQVGNDGTDLVVFGGVETRFLELPLPRRWRWRWRGRGHGRGSRGWRGRRRIGLRRRRDLLIRCGCSRGLCRGRKRRGGGVDGGGRSGHVRVRRARWEMSERKRYFGLGSEEEWKTGSATLESGHTGKGRLADWHTSNSLPLHLYLK
jgi:hypothetical protein